jgi:hypothetical protein
VDVVNTAVEDALRAIFGAVILFASVVMLTEAAARFVPEGAVPLVRIGGAVALAVTVVL